MRLRSAALGALFLCVLNVLDTPISADEVPLPSAETRIYRSPYSILYTDLPAVQAEERLRRMDEAVRIAARYWRRKPRGRVNCYLAADAANWSDEALPHRLARVWMGGIGGATIGEVVSDQRGSRPQATVYAAANHGIIEHEVVHAYCAQTFGRLGPDWYKEGMADVAMFQVVGDAGFAVQSERIQLLREGSARSIHQIVGETQFTRGISDSLGRMLQKQKPGNGHVPLSEWSAEDDDNLRSAKETYAWSWALCHMLTQNPNYAERFRVLGCSFLLDRDDTFAAAFDAMSHELAFEFAFFTERVDIGYRVDLCSWNWHRASRRLSATSIVTCSVAAARGYQPSGLQVAEGERIHFRTDGRWQLSPETSSLDADGEPNGAARLTGVVMQDFQLSEPITLGVRGSFVAPTDGHLYLRCQDAWNQLANNAGEIRVQFTPAP